MVMMTSLVLEEEIALEEMTIPNSMVGRVIGRGGVKIRQLQEESGCRIVLAISSNGEQSRAVALQGTTEQIHSARELINELLIGNLEFLIPKEKVGLLIGKKGERIKKIQSLTGAEIFLSQEEDEAAPGQSQISISGSQQAVEEASRKVLEILNNEFMCGICMEVVLQKEGENARFGILPSCSHCFCLSCITKWRKAKYEEKLTKACPECRVEQDFVIPSKVWIENTICKAELVERFKKNAAMKDCKIYKENFGKCPSGSKCLYRHQNLTNGEQFATVKIPENLVGLIIGKGGSTIKTLQAETNTRMFVMQCEDEEAGERDLRIVGDAADVPAAVWKVNYTVFELKMKKLNF